MELTLAKWPVELVLIANAMGREVYLDMDRIQTILSPAIQATCRLKPEETFFFYPYLSTRAAIQPLGHQRAQHASYHTGPR